MKSKKEINGGNDTIDSMIIFPNQLFEKSKLLPDKTDHIFLVEDPLFFYDAKNRPFKTHKLKMMFHRASLKYYKTFLEGNGFKNVHYVEYDAFTENQNQNHNRLQSIMKSVKTLKLSKQSNKQLGMRLKMIDPHDFTLLRLYETDCKKAGIELQIILDDQMFLMSKEDLDVFHEKNKDKKTIQHSSFYDFVKTKQDILVKEKSYDEENRNSLPNDFDVKIKGETTFTNFHDEAILYVKNHKQFREHYGNLSLVDDDDNKGERFKITNEVVSIPVTHAGAKKHLQSFLKHKFQSFGKYQDAAHKDYAVLYHSHCSFLLNSGLLAPRDVIDSVMKFGEAKSRNVPMNSLEGFVRQLIGWREYMRYIYEYHFEEITTSNILDQDRGIVDMKAWYDGTTGIYPIDNEIRKIHKMAHAHHIVRLMFLLNFMILCNVRLYDIYRWFMEMVAIDAYPWVMLSNISAMGFFTKKFMRKPYLTTSNYILKMSNYEERKEEGKGEGEGEKNKKWTTIWDDLFYHFLNSKETLIKKHAAIYTRNLAYYRKKSDSEKKRLNSNARNFVDNVTSSKIANKDTKLHF